MDGGLVEVGVRAITGAPVYNYEIIYIGADSKYLNIDDSFRLLQLAA